MFDVISLILITICFLVMMGLHIFYYKRLKNNMNHLYMLVGSVSAPKLEMYRILKALSERIYKLEKMMNKDD